MADSDKYIIWPFTILNMVVSSHKRTHYNLIVIVHYAVYSLVTDEVFISDHVSNLLLWSFVHKIRIDF